MIEIKITREEFVKRLGGNEKWESSYYEIILKKNMVLLDREGWQRIKMLIENHLSKMFTSNESPTRLIEWLAWFEELRKEIET